MKKIKGNSKILKKSRRFSAGSETSAPQQNIDLSQRVFLYLHPRCIAYPSDDLLELRPEIEIEHQFNTITTLSDHYVSSNIIKLYEFDTAKPTFSLTIEQDSLEDITRLSDCPILLTLYVYTTSDAKVMVTEEQKEEDGEEQLIFEEIRTAVAQGHIDIIDFFNNKRTKDTDTVLLYPLKSQGQHLACKTEWEIYSLHPLLRNLTLSNYLFLTLDALYNIGPALMDDCQNLVANFSFISKIPDNANHYDKIFICNFKTFSKSIIAEQNLAKTWESLKSNTLGNFNCRGISAGCELILNQLFTNLLSTENVNFNFSGINKNEDVALICNSIHRYVLTDNMSKILENLLAHNLYQILVEICAQENEAKVLLQGYVDLSIFMYPKVNNCSFAVELRPPGAAASKDHSANKSTAKNGKFTKTTKIKSATQQQGSENKIPFAIVQISLSASITDPCQDLNATGQQRRKNKFCQYPIILPKTIQFSLRSNCAYNYKSFDDLVLEILDYIVNNNIATLNDDKEFFCHQISNMNNKILKILCCDFNVKTPTNTNIEFTNLITAVYRDLIERIYNIINKCSVKSLKNCVYTDTTTQNFIVRNMSLVKYLHEVGNVKMANVFLEQLRTEYCNNTMLKFYICLYDIERQHFEQVQDYLTHALDDKDIEGELFAGLIQAYVTYKLQLQDAERNETAEEELIAALRDYSECKNATPLTGFILLYCAYKRHNYLAGMAYCRWRYENLFDSIFVQLQFIPKSRWDIHLPYKINCKSTKGQNFTKVYYNLLRLGLYTFAQWVFHEIADECTEFERYIFESTYTILENNVQDKMKTKIFSFDKLENAKQLHAISALVNGNLEYMRVPASEEYMKHYKCIVELAGQDSHSHYQLGLLRYGYKKITEQDYEEASQAFLNLCSDSITGVVAAIERGRACYHLGLLDEAEEYFALSTEHGVYVKNVWEFLALINLRKGNNYNALECWKYARLNPNTSIDKYIFDELNKINYSDVELFVDCP